jgi:pyruvate dehydrogenase E2 component (dihydrolipoamide acetyltransferase)
MPIEVIMPNLGAVVEESTLLAWRINEGDSIEKGQAIFEAESDKATLEVEAPESGTVHALLASPGDIIPAGAVIALLLKPGETPQDAKAVPTSNKEEQVSTSKTKKDTIQDDHFSKPDGRIKASPRARVFARQHRIDLMHVKGTGPGERIIKADVDDILAQSLSSASFPGSRSGFDDANARQIRKSEVIPISQMRRTIANRMTISHQSIPHIKLTSQVDMTRLIAARNEMNARAMTRGEQKVSITVFLVKLLAMTLRDHPWLNSSITEDSILLHKEINIGVAVALESGLIVPVVKNADLKEINQIAIEVSERVTRAREEQLVSSDLEGGTFTISNLGSFGVGQFEAIINPPEAAILAVGGIHQTALPLEDGQIVSRPVMNFTLSADHRIVDGAVAARFSADLKTLIENPIYDVLEKR